MGKVNKNSSAKTTGLQRKQNKILDVFEFSESEKQFIIEKYSQVNSSAMVQSLYMKEFPTSAVPSYKLISKLGTKYTETRPQTDCGAKKAANLILRLAMDSPNVYKSTTIQSRAICKQLKKKRYRQNLSNRLSKILHNKRTSANISIITDPLNNNKNSTFSGSLNLENSSNENLQHCRVDNVDCSRMDILQPNVSNINPKKRKWLNVDIENNSNIETISLDSPQPKFNKDTPAICEIDLTCSPNINNNAVCLTCDGSNKCASSTPFTNFKHRSYAHVASLSTTDELSPIKKKTKILPVDFGESSKKSSLATCTSSLLIDDDPNSFITIDQSLDSELMLNDQFVNTVINVDNVEKCKSQLQDENQFNKTENCLDTSTISSLSNVTVVTKENVDKVPIQSIDLTEDNAALNICDTKAIAPSNQFVYDLTLDQNDSIALNTSLNTLERRRSHLIKVLADTVSYSSARLMKKSHINRNGSNIYFPGNHKDVVRAGLRMVVIDGSNVALSHRHGKFFSVEGLKICIDYFLQRGHEVKTFVPRFRNKRWKSSNPRLLDQLEQAGHVVYTPSREIKGRCIASYDDRYIVQCAVEFQGVIVSGDNYRDLLLENESWRETIEQRLLPFTWVGDMLMFPQDPLGRNGPKLGEFLSHPNPHKQA